MSQKSSSPIVRLGPIYQRDVLSFLVRDKLDECALVSRSLYSTISRLPPASIPRRRFSSLRLYCSTEEELRRVLLLNNSGGELETTGRPFRERLFDQRRVPSHLEECEDCEELKEIAEELVNELVFVNRDTDLKAGIKACEMRHTTTICVPNHLVDASAAFKLLHFLQHLHDAYFDDLLLPHRAADPTPILNPTITRLLGDGLPGRWRRYRLHCVNYMPGPALVRVLTADETADARMGETVRFRRIECTLFVGGIESALEMVIAAGAHCRSVKFIVPDRRSAAVKIEQIIDFFKQRTSDELRDAIGEVEFCFGTGFGHVNHALQQRDVDSMEMGMPEKRWVFSTTEGKKFRAEFTWGWSRDVHRPGLEECSLSLLLH